MLYFIDRMAMRIHVKDSGKRVKRKENRDQSNSLPRRREGEDYPFYVLRCSARGDLIPIDNFMKEVFKLKIPHLTEIEIIKSQYQLAVENKKINWIRELRHQSKFIFTSKWINEHYPLSNLDVNNNKAKPTKLELEDISSDNSSSGESGATYVVRSVTNCDPVTSSDNESIRSNATYTIEKKDSETRPYKGNSINSWCIVPHCKVQTKRLKKHVMLQHLPKLFHERESEQQLQDIVFHEKRLEQLQILAKLVGGPESDIRDLMSYVDRHIAPYCKIPEQTESKMRKMCEMLGWKKVDKFTLYPMNSPAILILWRPLITILEGLNDEQCRRFRDGDLSLGSAKKRKVDRSEERRLPAFDSHFHLDRTRLQLFGPTSNAEPEDLLEYKMKKPPAMPVNVVGGVIVFSEPWNYPKEFKFDSIWKVAIGLHPKKIDQFSEDICRKMANLMKEPRIAALGEIGLDRRTDTPEQYLHQEKIFKRMLGIAVKDKPIILHLRGIKKDPYGRDVHLMAWYAMTQACSSQQKIHMHCFSGTCQELQMWNQSFPCTYFGVTAVMKFYNEEQLKAIRGIPENRLLIETDSPYLGLNSGNKCNTPAYIGEVAEVVATARKVSVSHILEITLQNGRRLYQ